MYVATMSGFITKPPAATMTAEDATYPVCSKDFQATPTTAPSPSVEPVETTRLVTPVS